jgi:transposase-like protein
MEKPPIPRCPNLACENPHVIRNGSSGGRRRYQCRGCGLFFGETIGTPMYRLHTSAAEVARALLVVMRRGSLRAAEEITGHKYETIGEWLRRASEHAEALNAVLADDLHLSTVEIDEFWSFVRKKTATMGNPTSANAGDAWSKTAPAALSLPARPDASAMSWSNAPSMKR